MPVAHSRSERDQNHAWAEHSVLYRMTEFVVLGGTCGLFRYNHHKPQGDTIPILAHGKAQTASVPGGALVASDKSKTSETTNKGHRETPGEVKDIKELSVHSGLLS